MSVNADPLLPLRNTCVLLCFFFPRAEEIHCFSSRWCGVRDFEWHLVRRAELLVRAYTIACARAYLPMRLLYQTKLSMLPKQITSMLLSSSLSLIELEQETKQAPLL